MFCKLKLSISRVNYKLYIALIILALAPTIYTTVRVFFLGQLPGEWAFSIAGQLSWINLLYEILNEAIILPLFYFIGNVKDNKNEFSNRVRTGLIFSLFVYSVLATIIITFTKPLLTLMATDVSIIAASTTYIRIESVANIFSILTQFTLVALVTINKSKYLYLLTGAKLLLCLVVDTFLVSTLPFSLNLGVNGIGY
ncbi:MAG: multidrug transporter, partial [Agathobacter sp.]|nr:multidrug transporter [Agathobacter sp.]